MHEPDVIISRTRVSRRQCLYPIDLNLISKVIRVRWNDRDSSHVECTRALFFFVVSCRLEHRKKIIRKWTLCEICKMCEIVVAPIGRDRDRLDTLFFVTYQLLSDD